MIKYLEEVLQTVQVKYAMENSSDQEKAEAQANIDSLQGNLDRLKPIIDAHDEAFNQMLVREEEMDKLIHEFKNSLLIEKIKMDRWESRKT